MATCHYIRNEKRLCFTNPSTQIPVGDRDLIYRNQCHEDYLLRMTLSYGQYVRIQYWGQKFYLASNLVLGEFSSSTVLFRPVPKWVESSRLFHVKIYSEYICMLYSIYTRSYIKVVMVDWFKRAWLQKHVWQNANKICQWRSLVHLFCHVGFD